MAFLIGQTLGDYTILQELTDGGSGVVYKVEQTITGRREAMKVLAAGTPSSVEQTERFIREIRLQANLSHPNIAAVHNAFLANDDLVLVCEFLHGESLETLLARGPLPLTHGTDILSQVLAALSHAHAHGVMHGDVSPANIFITTNKIVKLIDFGLAKAATEVRVTREGSLPGSVHYMSPEQVRGEDAVDVRTDIYNCGAVLYQLATGRTLFDRDSALEIMKAHLEEMPTAPRSINPRIPTRLESIILKAVEKKPEDRFQSADSFYQALRQVNTECLRPTMVATSPAWQLRTAVFAGAACLSLALAVFAEPIHLNVGENALAASHAITVRSNEPVAVVRPNLPPHQIAPEAVTLVHPAMPLQPMVRRAEQADTKTTLAPDEAIPAQTTKAPENALGTGATIQSHEQPVKKIARSLKRLNPFLRKPRPNEDKVEK